MIEPETVDRAIDRVRRILEPLVGAEYLDELRAFVLDDDQSQDAVSGHAASLSYRLGLGTAPEVERWTVQSCSNDVLALINYRRAEAGLGVDVENLRHILIPTVFERLAVEDSLLPNCSTNGKVVWVNGPRCCLARYCPISGEVWWPELRRPDPGDDEPEIVLGESWGAWVARVAQMHHVAVPPSLRPAWSQRAGT